MISECRRCVRDLYRVLRAWLDPSTRRPLILLALVAFAIFLWPLAVDVARALFSAIPVSVRWFGGQAAIVAGVAAGLWRLYQVRPSDEWPEPEGIGPTTPAARWIPWALRLAVASLTISMMRHPDGLGWADWDFFLDKLEAARRTIALWGQFPWWDPWCRGGFPLAAEPQIGAVSMATPLILALGTSRGMQIATVLCYGIAVEGAYRLAWHWLRDPWAAAMAALVYGLSGAVSVNVAGGYGIVMSYCSLPWLAYHACRIGGAYSQGIGLGFWGAFALLNGIQYVTLYALALTAAIWLRALRVQPVGSRLRVLWNTIAAAGMLLVLSAWRLVTVLEVLGEDRRERITGWNVSIITACRSLVDRPRPDWPKIFQSSQWGDYTAITSYVGAAAVILAVWSVSRGWRWWHTLVLLTAWLALGSTRWYHPSSWLADWPLFGSAHVVTRWRVVALLGLGLAAGSTTARWRRSAIRGVRLLAATLTLAVGADLVVLAHQQLPWAFSVTPEPSLFPGPSVREIVNVSAGLGYACAQRGYGVIFGYEPMLSYRREAPTLRRGRDQPGYLGESWTAEGRIPIHPDFWSPNRLIFRLRPGQEVFINQNPGSWWLVNGRREFADRRIAEPMLPFVVRADDAGRLELRIDPPGRRLGAILHLVGASILAANPLARRLKIARPLPLK